MEQTEDMPLKKRGRPGTDAPKWRSFPKVPNLLQYVSTGLYYARVQIRGNNIRKSLKTKVWSTAKLRLRDFLTAHETKPPLIETIPFPTAVARLEASILPEPDQFGKLVEAIRSQPGKLSSRIADQVEFLAYSGMRAFSEGNWVNWEDIDWQREELIIRGHPETRTKNNESRRVPIIADMHELLKRLDGGNKSSGKILQMERCEKRLRLACVDIGIPVITLHDLRHLFATRCIESGVDIPTVSRWLGHKDGGALAMKTYGHLRNEHSKAMAKKVKF